MKIAATPLAAPFNFSLRYAAANEGREQRARLDEVIFFWEGQARGFQE